jgi:hypothetical protein
MLFTKSALALEQVVTISSAKGRVAFHRPNDDFETIL